MLHTSWVTFRLLYETHLDRTVMTAEHRNKVLFQV